MKTLKYFFKPISSLLVFLILLQGCVVYQKNPSGLDEAIQSKGRVKVEQKNGETEKFKQIIVLDDESTYGRKHIRNKSKQFYELVAIDEDQISNIYLKDKTVSALVTLAIPLSLFLGLYAIFQSELNNIY